MRTRILLQVGAYHKDKTNPQADFLKLASYNSYDVWELLREHLNLKHVWKIKKIWRLLDKTPHLIEFEAITES